MTALFVALIALTGSILAGLFSLRGQLAGVKATREQNGRLDLWKLIDKKDEEIAGLRADMKQLQALYGQQGERLELLEKQRIRDQIEIQDLQLRVRNLGGNV